MFKLVVLTCLVAAASAQWLGATGVVSPLGLGLGAPLASPLGLGLGAPLASPLGLGLGAPLASQLAVARSAGLISPIALGAPLASPLTVARSAQLISPLALGAPLASSLAANYRGPISLAPGQPASILAADGRPLDTLDVNLDRSAHITAKALESSGIHVLKKRSIGAPPVATSIITSPLITRSALNIPAAGIVSPLNAGVAWGSAPIVSPISTSLGLTSAGWISPIGARIAGPIGPIGTIGSLSSPLGLSAPILSSW